MKNNTLTVINDKRIADFLVNFYEMETKSFEIPSIGKITHYTFKVEDALEQAFSYCEHNPDDPEARYFFRQLLEDTADIWSKYARGGDRK